MAGKSSKKPPAKKAQQQNTSPFDDFDEEIDGFEEDISGIDADDTTAAPKRSRDWRDVEKLREIRELRKLVGNDLDDLLEGFEAEPPRSKKNKP